MKNLKGRNKKLKKEIEKGEFGGLIIGRSKSQQAIDTKIDQLAEEFQKAEGPGEIPELGSEGVNILRGWVMFSRKVKKAGSPHSEMTDRDEKEKEERPKKKRERANPLEVELELSGGISQGIC